MAPSNTELWGAGCFTWGGGPAGAQLGGGNMGGARYPTASGPLGPDDAIGFGSRPIKYTWGGGRSGMTLTPHGPHVGEGLPGPDPHAFGVAVAVAILMRQAVYTVNPAAVLPKVIDYPDTKAKPMQNMNVIY